jgi:thiamine pyrophosphokinase
VIEIRPFRPNETEAVVALWDSCDLIRPWNDPRRDIERKLRVDPELFLVAVEEENADVIAFYGALGYRTDDVVSLGKRVIDD